jgi:CheY-like chemotaxis protein
MHKKRILVVDDEPGITHLLKLTLERTGQYEVREENASVLALAAAREFQPNLILMDVMMPGVTGGDVAASLRDEPGLRKVPIVFLTAAVKREEIGGPDARIGGQHYIAKPLDVQGVIAVLERTLGP